VGRLVRLALDRGVRLQDLPLAEIRQIAPACDEAVYQVLGARQAVGALTTYGSSGAEQVRLQIERWKERLRPR
jgi:argininosuccinate lyase